MHTIEGNLILESVFFFGLVNLKSAKLSRRRECLLKILFGLGEVKVDDFLGEGDGLISISLLVCASADICSMQAFSVSWRGDLILTCSRESWEKQGWLRLRFWGLVSGVRATIGSSGKTDSNLDWKSSFLRGAIPGTSSTFSFRFLAIEERLERHFFLLIPSELKLRLTGDGSVGGGRLDASSVCSLDSAGHRVTVWLVVGVACLLISDRILRTEGGGGSHGE